MNNNAIVKSPVTQVALSEDVIAETINSRFEEVKSTANTLRMQMLGVGFTLVQAERELEKMGKIDRNGKTDGMNLSRWLAKRCPALPYKTAMDWKNLAEKSLKKIGGNEGEALQLMMESEDEQIGRTGLWTKEQLEARNEIYSCETKSELKQMLMPFFEAGHAGRPVGSVQTGRKTDTNDPAACARAEWSRVIVPATNTVVLEAAAKLLSRNDVEDALVALKTLIDYLKARKAELK